MTLQEALALREWLLEHRDTVDEMAPDFNGSADPFVVTDDGEQFAVWILKGAYWEDYLTVLNQKPDGNG